MNRAQANCLVLIALGCLGLLVLWPVILFAGPSVEAYGQVLAAFYPLPVVALVAFGLTATLVWVNVRRW